MVDNNKGEISEWNEGDYKNLRLHKAQELINSAYLNPLGKMFLFGITKCGYQFWFDGVDILYGEGVSKYSDVERTEIEELRTEVERLIDESPAYQNIINPNGQKGYSIDFGKWKPIKEKLRKFEYKVKRCNDQHGLSTRNKDEDEGL